MKIAVLTMVFNNNYGGYLQCYALMESLKKMGHQPELLYACYQDTTELVKLKRFVKLLVKQFAKGNIISFFATQRRLNAIEKNTKYFAKNYIIPKTRKVRDYSDFKKYASSYDAYVVGSDQVWRPTMYPFIEEAFFSFVEKKDAILISYAASFGVDYWEYTAEQTKKFKKDLARFKAVSVREDSGVKLCEEYWSVDAKHVLDPTMLLSVKQYKNLVALENEPKPKGEILTYILDATDEKNSLIKYICEFYKFNSFTVNRDVSNVNYAIYPTVTSWVKGFVEAKFVVTDSFHGCVFAILFNKPFIVYGNQRRGLSRFDSLLKMFDLQKRLILRREELTEERLSANIDWVSVNNKLAHYRQESFSFLTKSLETNIP